MSFDEAGWWGDCANTFHEEEKQLVYASRMGLRPEWTGAHPPTYDIGGRSVLDIGGGPVSILLKCRNRGQAVVVDPGDFPPWVFARYGHCGIDFWHGPAEEIDDELRSFDEAWVYNVLQHVIDPAEVLAKARRYASTIRVFEWINVQPYDGHPHLLTRDGLDEMLDGTGFVVDLNERGCVGEAYYGVFRGT
jgi:hypothetical protein